MESPATRSQDHFFLLIMTAMSFLILYVDLKVLEEMFKELFIMKNFVEPNTYTNCYEPQAVFRICFQCGALYCAVACVVLIGALTLGLSDDMVEKVAQRVINSVVLIFGPVMLVCSMLGFYKIKAIASVCSITKIQDDQINFSGIFSLLIFFCVSLGITLTLLYERTMSIV